jgi:hypothetical protein
MTEQKSVSAGGGRLRRFGGFAGGAAPANVQLKRRHAASDNKTNIPAWIFPNARLFYSKTRCDRFVRDVCVRSRNLPLHLNSRRPTLQRIFDCLAQSFQFGINKT